MQKLFSIFLLVFICTFSLKAQSSDEVYNKMINSIMIGLEEQGLKLAMDIISETKYEKVREKSLYFVSTYLFHKIRTKEVSDDAISRAYYFLAEFKKEYPNSNLIVGINYALNYMEDNYRVSMLLKTLDDYFQAQLFIVGNKLNFATDLIHIKAPSPYDFLSENDYEGNATTIAKKYFEDIIVNNPEFEAYGYYYKILTNLALFRSDIISSGLFDVQGGEENVYYWDDTNLEANNARSEILDELDYLNKNYASLPLTLDLNLIIANMYLEANSTWDNELKKKATPFFQNVLNNDPNKVGYRYLLVKEFVLNNNLN